MSRKWALFLAILIGGMVLDQITKLLVVQTIPLGEQIPVIEGFFNLVFIYNRGAAFGLLANLPPGFTWIFFIIIKILVMGVVAYLWWRLPPDQTLAAVGFSLIFTGAAGNLIDRVRLGQVIDFLDFHVGRYHWPAFNVADSLICVGAGFLLWYIFREEKTPDVSHPL